MRSRGSFAMLSKGPRTRARCSPLGAFMFKNLSAVIALALTLLAARNVYGDFTEVEAQARALAEGRGEAFLSQVSRNPLSHDYTFSVKGQTRLVVSCSRSAILLGEYSCEIEE